MNLSHFVGYEVRITLKSGSEIVGKVTDYDAGIVYLDCKGLFQYYPEDAIQGVVRL